MKNSNAEVFLECYRELEYAIRNKYNLDNWESAINYLTSKREFRSLTDELKYCREVRNLLAHKPKVDDQFCVEPSDRMIQLLKTVTGRIEMPPVIMDIAVPVDKILYKSLEDNVIQTLREMNEHSFGNVPILKDGVVKGVLSEKSIVQYIVMEKGFSIPETLTLGDIRSYLTRESHRKERYAFVGKNTLISDVANLFHKALDQGARIGMVFITGKGGEEEKLQGIVTAWDLAGSDKI